MVDKQIDRFNQIQVCKGKISSSESKKNESQSSSEEENDDSTSDESDFEEVPEKEGYESEAISSAVNPPPVAIDQQKPCSSRSITNTSKGWSLWDVQKDDVHVMKYLFF